MKKNPYYVSFFKRLYDCTGHSHECCQGEVEVLAANDSEAVVIARRRFAELKHIADWSLFADYEKVWHVTALDNAPASGAGIRTGSQEQRDLEDLTRL